MLMITNDIPGIMTGIEDLTTNKTWSLLWKSLQSSLEVN